MSFGAKDSYTSSSQNYNSNSNTNTSMNQSTNSSTNQTQLNNSSEATSGVGTTNQTSTTGPWGAVTPLITGDGGVLNSIAANYGQFGQLSPAQLAAIQASLGQVQDQAQLGGAVTGAGMALLGTPPVDAQQVRGQYISYANLPTIGGSSVSAQSVDPSAAFATLGAADPTSALKTALSGSVDNPFLAGVASGNIASARQQFGDLTEDQANGLNFNALPSLRTQAALSGQYGGSREGALEGVATGLANQTLTRAARDLTASTTATNSGLYGTAYQQAQDRAATVGQGLATLGAGIATGNADRNLTASQSNASNSLAASEANAAQLMDATKTNIATDADLNKFNANVTLENNAQRIAQAQAAAGLLGTGTGLTAGNTEGQLGLLGYGANYAGQQLGLYAGQVGQLAQLGGTTSLSGQSTNNQNTTGQSSSNLTGETTGNTTGETTSNTVANGSSHTTSNTLGLGLSSGGAGGGGGGSSGSGGGGVWDWLTGV